MRVDTMDAITTFEMLGEAVKAAGTGKYCGFQLVEALKDKGKRLILEDLPVVEMPKMDIHQIADETRLAAE